MIGSIGTSFARPAGTPRGGTAATEAALDTARGQLEDWITCPSRVTPEGKAKIKESTDKVETLKKTLAQERTDGTVGGSGANPVRVASPVESAARSPSGVEGSDAAYSASRRFAPGASLGTTLDAYA